MIQEFVAAWDKHRYAVRGRFLLKHPNDYTEVVKILVETIFMDQDFEVPDHTRIHSIDDGHYQGRMVFVVAGKGYQPSLYWYTSVDYGSCSGCDTLQSIQGYDDGIPTEQQADDYTTLALHLLQAMKKMDL